jgi:hypothetical protein
VAVAAAVVRKIGLLDKRIFHQLAKVLSLT